jgi:hypothetical protein
VALFLGFYVFVCVIQINDLFIIIIYYSAQDALRETLKDLEEQFRKKFFQDIEIDYENYASLEQLHAQLEAIYKVYRSYCRQFIREFYADVDTGADHPLRRCPHCSLVWMKVEGCSGTTTCGARPKSAEARVKLKCEWVRQAGKILFHPTQVPEVVTKTGKLLLAWLDDKIVPTFLKRSVGCGKEISWSEMPPVSVPPELVSVPDYADASNVPVSNEQQRLHICAK